MLGRGSHRAAAVADAAVLGAIAVAFFVFHLVLSGRYGYWIDELYFIACGDHLAWGYVDQPPLIAVVATVSRRLLGDSLFAIRFFPALAGAALVFLTGWIARTLGGGRTAQLAAVTAVIAAPVYELFSGLLTMNAFEPLLWMACAYLLILIAMQRSAKLWVLVGVVAGVGLLNKHSMAFFAAALAVGLLLSPQRGLLLSPWAWVGAVVALCIAAPNLGWEVQRGWPTVELLANAHRYQHQPVTPLQFVWGQIQLMQPLTFPLWAAGAFFLLRNPRAAGVRFLGWAFVFQFVVFLWMQAKTYYLTPIYPMLFAAGGVAVEGVARRSGRAWLPRLLIGLCAFGGLTTLPYVVPLLPIEVIPTYMRILGMQEVRSETRPMGDVPQIFADELSWDELVAEIARAWDALPAAERAHTAIWGRDYGVAGAVDYLGKRYGLPAAISGHQNYFLWGFHEPVQNLLAVGMNEASLSPWFERVELVGEVACPHCMPDRRALRIYDCRGLRVPLEQFWPLVKCWTCDRPAFISARPPAAALH